MMLNKISAGVSGMAWHGPCGPGSTELLFMCFYIYIRILYTDIVPPAPPTPHPTLPPTPFSVDIMNGSRQIYFWCNGIL